MSTSVVQNSEARVPPRQQPSKLIPPTGLLRKLTTKLKPLNLHPRSAIPKLASPPTSPLQPSPRRPAVPSASTDLAAVKRRQAALQQCGLVPIPRKDLSQLEQELDCKFSHLVVPPQDESEQGELTTAEKIRREWQSRNDEKQGDDPCTQVPSDVTSAPLDPAPLGKSDSARNAHEQQTTEPTSPAPPHTLPTPATPVSLYSVPGAFLFPDIPEEEGVTHPEIEKALPPPPPAGAVDPLDIPLPDSPLSSSLNLPELPPTPPLQESKRRPQIVLNVTTNNTKENAEAPTRGRSLTTKLSLPALSPTMTASSFSSIPTPRDDESMERIETIIARSSGGTSRAPRFGRASETGRDSEDLDVVHETIPEGAEPTAAESKTSTPNRESTPTIDSAGFEAFVEKKEKRRRTTGIFQSNKRGSGSISRKSTSSELSFRWGSLANEFSLKPLDGRRSRSSALVPTPASIDENKELTPTSSRIPIEQQSKISRSKSVIASLGLKMSRKVTLQKSVPALPSPPPLPVRQPTATIMHRERLLQEVKEIEDDETRRLTELAFMDF